MSKCEKCGRRFAPRRKLVISPPMDYETLLEAFEGAMDNPLWRAIMSIIDQRTFAGAQESAADDPGISDAQRHLSAGETRGLIELKAELVELATKASGVDV